MEFGITFKGFVSPNRARNLVRQAEEAGFTQCWFYDSHILWRESMVAMAMCMEHTTKMKFAPCVTSPDVRDWSHAASTFGSLALQSEGRFEIGLGRGDSANRVMGKKPATLARLAEFSQKVKAMIRGEEVTYDGCAVPVKFPWAVGYELPVHIAAYGPKALATAGQYGDGLILQIGDPDLVKWFTDQALAAGKEAGRDMSDFKVVAAAPAYFGSKEYMIEKTKWFPAMVGNHVADIVEKYGKETDLVPDSLTQFIETRKGKGADEGYDYRKHAVKDSENLYYVNNQVTESFCLVGPAEAHVEKLQMLEAAGVTQFTIYLTQGDEERLVAEYVDKVIPHFR